ncbi:MAG: thiol peroxidase [candidate division Zixibacteria bacterium]|nr:thiol peroxidase [candidate division Zixibacteria bacterium]
MSERTGLIRMKGNPLTLVGNEVRRGERAPDFEVMNEKLEPVRFSSFQGKSVVILSVPSVDTPVCDMETRRFNQEAAKLGDDVVILVISMDLPFAQKRWCAAADVANVQLLSDHRDASFGNSFGVLIKELRLLARTVFIVDRAGTVQYVQYVQETTEEPDYNDVLKAIDSIAKEQP